MPWLGLLPEDASFATGSPGVADLVGQPYGILGVPAMVARLAAADLGAAVLFVVVSLAAACALALVVVGGARVLRFRGGVGLLRAGLAIVAVIVIVGAPLMVVFEAGSQGSLLYPTGWPLYAFVCAAVASLAAARYDRLAGPDVDADDTRLRAEGFEVSPRRRFDAALSGDWLDGVTRAAAGAWPGGAEVVARAIACACGLVCLVLFVPTFVMRLLAVTGVVDLGEGASAGLDALLLDPQRVMGVLVGAASVAFVAQGVAAFARDRRTTGMLRAGALLLLLWGPFMGAGISANEAVVALLSAADPEALRAVLAGVAVAFVVSALLAAVLAGLADGMAFSRAARAVEE